MQMLDLNKTIDQLEKLIVSVGMDIYLERKQLSEKGIRYYSKSDNKKG